MKESLRKTAEWANRMSDLADGKERETFNYLGHFSLLAFAIIDREPELNSEASHETRR